VNALSQQSDVQPAGPPLCPDARGVFHPGTEDDIVALVRHASNRHMQVRVVGADRSEAASVHTDAFLQGAPDGAVELCLDRMRRVRFDDLRREVHVQAGCSIHRDPHAPAGTRPAEQGLVWQLDQHGWALPILTGGNCQTVGGYLATGSDGGSLSHAIGDSVVGLRLVDGTGRVHVLRREDGDARFLAAGVSMGLLGIVTEVSFRCVERFDIIGWEQTLPAADERLGLSQGDPEATLSLLRTSPYARIMWWAQPGVDKAVVWRARPLRDDEREGALDDEGKLFRRPYEEVPAVFGSTLPVQAAGGVALAALANAGPSLQRLAGGGAAGRKLVTSLRRFGRRSVSHRLYNAFVDAPATERRYFRDSWWQGLSMDSDVDERLMPVHFTELWVPWERAAEAIRRLRALFARDGYDAAGHFVTELYGGRASPFWMSPGHGADHLRINVFWLKYALEDPSDDFYPRYWEALDDLGFRFHWGKRMARERYLGRAWMGARYPHLDDFLALRDRLDPDQLFVTDHWRRQLGIGEPAVRALRELPAARVEHVRPMRGPRPWPLLFELTPTDRRTPQRVIENVAVIEAPIEQVFATATQPIRPREWVAWYRGIEWLGTPHLVGSSSIETFLFMSIQVRIVETEPPTRWVATVDTCSLPMVAEMGQEFRLARLPGGATELRWWIRYTPAPAFRWLEPLLRPFFVHMFWKSTRSLKRLLEAEPRVR